MKDNVQALYCDPNAYVKLNKKSNTIKQVVFSEPYDCLPNYYVDYGFKKRSYECAGKQAKKKEEKLNCNSTNKQKCNCENVSNPFSNLFGGIMKFLPMLLGGGNGGIGSILSSLNSNSKSEGDVSNLISSLMKSDNGSLLSNLFSNGNIMSSLTRLFTLNKNEKLKKEDIISTDYEIKNYTRV